MIVFFFTASSISRNQTSHKGRNVIEENVRTYNDQPDDWGAMIGLFFTAFQYHANKQGVQQKHYAI